MPKTPQEDSQKKEEEAFQQLDTAKIKQEVKDDLTPTIEEEVQKRLGKLGKQLTGEDKAQYSWEKEGRDKPKDWGEVISEVENRVDGKVEQRLKQGEEKKKKEMERAREKQQEQAREMSAQWQELVAKEALPEIDDSVAERLKAGQKVSETEAESDPGLQAWRKISTIAANEGKTFKEAYYEDYLSETAGQDAPVFGGKRSIDSTDGDTDYTYEEIQKARKRR